MKESSQPTIKNVANEAGVSIATVSRVLNNNKSVAPELFKKVWDAVEKLGYKPSVAARSMKGLKSNVIGFIVPDITMTYFNHMIAGAISKAQKYNYNILVSSTNSCPDDQKNTLQIFSTSVIDGLIFTPISQSSGYPSLKAFGSIPIVVAYRQNIYNNVPHINANNIKGGYIATKYLINLGRKKIAFLGGFYGQSMPIEEILRLINGNMLGYYSSIDRLKGYLKAHEEANIDIDYNRIISSCDTYIDGYNATQKILSNSIEVDSILAFNDSVAAGAINFLKEQKISVPDEISVIGYDDGPIAQIVQPTLTSVNQDASKIGATAVEMMMDLLNGKQIENKILDVSLSIRKSTSRKY